MDLYPLQFFLVYIPPNAPIKLEIITNPSPTRVNPP